jgi:hypothetical protein
LGEVRSSRESIIEKKPHHENLRDRGFAGAKEAAEKGLFGWCNRD